MLSGRLQREPMSILGSPMDRRVKPGDDETCRSRDAPSHPSFAYAKKSQAKKHSQKTPPLKRREAERRQAHQPGAAPKTDAARVLSPSPLLRGAEAAGTSWSGRARLSAPHRGIRGFCPRLGSGRASWNHRMQTGGPSPAPVQRAPRSPARAGRDDAQAARERSVSLRPREPLPLRPKEYPRERRPFASGILGRLSAS
jgi:hypothetical protein